jgi:hypothetical protein
MLSQKDALTLALVAAVVFFVVRYASASAKQAGTGLQAGGGLGLSAPDGKSAGLDLSARWDLPGLRFDTGIQ